MPNPGIEFEHRFAASAKAPNRYVLKLNTPPPPPAPGQGRARFTPRQPFDYLLSCAAPVPGSRVDFALELKSTDGSRLPHCNVNRTAGLSKAGAAGLHAGLIVEYRNLKPPADGNIVVFVPIGTWNTHLAQSTEKSLSFMVACYIGRVIYQEHGALNIDAFVEAFGAAPAFGKRGAR